MSKSGGAILIEEAYAAGKMLDHSEWQNILPRGITPSDIDMFIESHGMFLWCELKYGYCRWNNLSVGQRIAFRKLMFSNPRKHFICLLTHLCDNIQINTVTDIESVYLYLAKERVLFELSIPFGKWPDFVAWFCRGKNPHLLAKDHIVTEVV